MNLKDLSTQLLFTTLPIWTQGTDGKAASATAFIYNVPIPDQPNRSIPLLVTNHHVVRGAKRAVIELVERNGDQPATDRSVRAEIDGTELTKHVSELLDVAAIPLGGLLNQMETSGKPAFFRSVSPDSIPSGEALKDLAAMEDIVFIGYPSGLRDAKNSTPIIRRGITATPVWNDFEGHPGFLIDAGVFPGSSGSPVFILNQGSYATRESLVVGSRLLFLGIITDTVVRTSSDGNVFLGLGKVTRSTALGTFLAEVAASLR